MKALAATAAIAGSLLVLAGSEVISAGRPTTPTATSPSALQPPATTAPLAVHRWAHRGSASISNEALTALVRRLCGVCHNDQLRTGNLSLTTYDVGAAARTPEITEKMISKLRAGMMPPPGIPRPGGDTLQVLVETLERLMDEAAATSPNPGGRGFQRLNRSEYE